MRALLIVDAQNDFSEGGALGVAGATDAFRLTAAHLADHDSEYALIVTTQDWHIDPGSHWSETPDFYDTWPRHCAAGEQGAELHPIIAAAVDRTTRPRAAVFKGQYAAAYSGFDGADDAGRRLAELLRLHAITALDIVGVATDFCVRATVIDALSVGLSVTVLGDQTAAVGNQSEAEDILREAGATVDVAV